MGQLLIIPSVIQIVFGILFGITAGVISYRLQVLSRGGAVASAILGVFIFGAGGLQWTLPMLAFFIPSSVLSKWTQRYHPTFSDSFEKGSRRDAMQVFANGGIGMALVIISLFYETEKIYLAYLGGLAAVTADTWGTELGVFSSKQPVLITTFKNVEGGISGGISAFGTLCGLAGAMIIALSGLYWVSVNVFQGLLIVGVAGFGGSLVDSLIGATVQEQFQCVVCKKVTEQRLHCTLESMHYRGLGWVNNDVVNAVCAITGAILAFVINEILPRSH